MMVLFILSALWVSGIPRGGIIEVLVAVYYLVIVKSFIFL
jgi:hypothetical protein